MTEMHIMHGIERKDIIFSVGLLKFGVKCRQTL